MAATKHEDKMKELGGERGRPLSSFHAYDLVDLGVPVHARPLGGANHMGRHGYTIHSHSGAVPCSKRCIVQRHLEPLNSAIHVIGSYIDSDVMYPQPMGVDFLGFKVLVNGSVIMGIHHPWMNQTLFFPIRAAAAHGSHTPLLR